MKTSKDRQQEMFCASIADDKKLASILGLRNVYSVCKAEGHFWAYTSVHSLDKETIDRLTDYCNRRILTFTMQPLSISRHGDTILVRIRPLFLKWNPKILEHETTRDDVEFFYDVAQRELQKELNAKTNDDKRRASLLSAIARIKSVVSEYDCRFPVGITKAFEG